MLNKIPDSSPWQFTCDKDGGWVARQQKDNSLNWSKSTFFWCTCYVWICIFCNFAAFIDSCYDSLI